MELITFKGKDYPKLQSEGFAAKFAFPFAKELCKGIGVDVGYSKPEWKLPFAEYGIDIGKYIIPSLAKEIEWEECSSDQFPVMPKLDFLFSSHALEHVPNWVETLEYWHYSMKEGAILFLYLPDCHTQVYWRNWHNRKHLNYMTPEIMKQYLTDMSSMWKNSFVTGTDLNNSFYAIAEKV